ncbi:hypothetical protein Tco_0257893 [Tanacetum coccineum]
MEAEAEASSGQDFKMRTEKELDDHYVDKSIGVNVNTGKQNVSSGRLHVSSGTHIKSGTSRFNTGKKHVNSGSIHVNTARITRPVLSNPTSQVWICQISQEISQKRTRERMSDQEAKEIKAEAKRIMPQPSAVNYS